jgi:uncharacterized protein (TIGR03435 family)
VANAAFEAASIKPSVETRDAEPTSMVMPGGRYVATNVTLRRLVRTAYALQEAQVVGGPSWVDDDRFDVLATANRAVPAATFREQFRPLLATLLRERFGLLVHKDMRELPAYALVVSRRDGKLGPQLRRSVDSDCAPSAPAPRNGPLAPQFATGQPLPCGAWYTQPGRLTGRAEFGRLVETLAPLVDRVVVDRTNLTGRFDWDLQWQPVPASPGDTPVADASASIFTALNEQLGLRLESRKLPVDVLVIDRAEHLTAN